MKAMLLKTIPVTDKNSSTTSYLVATSKRELEMLYVGPDDPVVYVLDGKYIYKPKYNKEEWFIEINCRTCKHEGITAFCYFICSASVGYCDWEWRGIEGKIDPSCDTCKSSPKCPHERQDKCNNYSLWEEMKMSMENEMPELKPGMVVELSGKKLIILESENGLFAISMIDGNWYYPLRKEDVARIFIIKDASPVQQVAMDNNLKLVWERLDWSKVAVDTKVLVRDSGDRPWLKRHFAKIGIYNRVATFINGRTSFSSDGSIDGWNYAILYEGNEHLVKEGE